MADKTTTHADENLLTLEQLRDALPAADDALHAALVAEHPSAEYVARGADIATGRVVTDARRIYSVAWAFYSQASDEHTALALRDQALSLLTRVAGSALTADVHGKNVGAATASDLATSLSGLAQVGATLIGHKKDDVARRAKANHLTQAYLDRLMQASKDAIAIAKAHAAGSRHPVSQGALDLNDGIQLSFIGHVLDTFEKAHDVDPTIPRIVPIATRRLFGAHHAASANGGVISADGPNAAPAHGA